MLLKLLSRIAGSPVDNGAANEETGGISWSSFQTLDEKSFCFTASGLESQVLIVNDNLLYRIKAQWATSYSYWKCHRKGCHFRALYDSHYSNVIRIVGDHTHPPEPGSLRKWKLINSVRMKIVEKPDKSPKEIYDAEVDFIKRQLSDGSAAQWKIPSYSHVKHFLHHDEKDTKKDTTDREAEKLSSTSTKSELSGRGVTEAEREFLEESSSEYPEISCMNLPLLSPKHIKSKQFPDLCFYFAPSRKGKRLLVVNDFTFHLNAQKSGGRFYWKCTVESCLYRCVYNEEIDDIVKVTGTHSHSTNIHQLRLREFIHLLKNRLIEDPSLAPKSVYDEELDKLKSLENGAILVSHMPTFASIKTTLYSMKHRKNFEANGKSVTDSCASVDSEVECHQDISPKAITHLSLEDEENMDFDTDEKEPSSSELGSNLEIATPTLYDSHDIINQLSSKSSSENKLSQNQSSQSQEEFESESQNKSDPSSYTYTFIPTNRGGQALAVNDCVLRSSFVRDCISYWRCQLKGCQFKCSYDTKINKLLRVSGTHNHSINPWNLHIRSFVRQLKKRMSQDSYLSSKNIYDQEILRLKKEGKRDDLLSKLPSYESLKSTLYKVRKSNLDCVKERETDPSGSPGSEDNNQDGSRRHSVDPPQDSAIESIYIILNTHLPSWLGQDLERKIVDGHILTKKSSTDNSTGWICCRKGCLFRCVIDNESKTVLRGKWHHTHRSEVRQLICQTMFNAVKRRALVEKELNPKNIYDQEKKRMESKISPNPALLKFIPSFAQVYQLIVKARAKQPPNSNSKLGNDSNFSNSNQILNIEKISETPRASDSSKRLPAALSCENRSSKMSLLKDIQHSYPHEQRTLSQNQIKTNCGIEGIAYSVEEMEPSISHEQHLFHHLNYDFSINPPVMNHELVNSQRSLRDSELVTNRSSQRQELVLNEVPVSSTQHHHDPEVIQDTTVISQPHLKSDYLAVPTFHAKNEFDSINYQPQTNRQLNNSISPPFVALQDARISLSNSQSSQGGQISLGQGHQTIRNQPALPSVDLGKELSHDSSSILPPSFILPSSSSSLSSSGATSYVSAPSSMSSQLQHNLYPSCSLPMQSSMDKNVFILHGYPVFPASAQGGHIYWQCRVPDCHFQGVYNVTSGQMVQISDNHSHEPPSSQQALASQVTKMLLRKAVEDLDKTICSIYWDYMQSLHKLLDSDSILNSFPRYEDVMRAMQNARAAMGITSEKYPKTMLQQYHFSNKTPKEYSSSTQAVTVRVHDTEGYLEFSLDSENNRLILHGEELLFVWRKNEIRHWKCKQADCRFKCVYDEEIESLHILCNHSPHCSSESKERYHGPSVKRRYSDEVFTRPSKFQRKDQ